MSDRPLGLYTDLYELRMVDSFLRGSMTQPATFSLYVRPNPRRPWLVAGGLHAALDVIDRFTYGADALDYLRQQGVSEQALQWLADFQPRGDITAVAEGTVVLANEPLLEITAPLPQAQLVEAAVMNVVHLWTLIATKAARCALAAGDRTVVDFGMRRAHGLETSVNTAMAAYLGGCAATSNVEAGRRAGIPVVGTMAHSYIQAHDEELTAFRRFAADYPDSSVLLVDTYDTITGVRRAITVADELAARGHRLRGVRLDSGDLTDLAIIARKMLDDAGHTDVQVFASGGLDEHVIAELGDAPIDAFGVGTALTVSADEPAVDIAYKLVDYDGRPRAKYSEHKVLLPGAKQTFRQGGPDTDVLGCRHEDLAGRELLQPVCTDGKRHDQADLGAAQQRARGELGALPASWRSLEPFDAPPQPRVSAALADLAARTHEAVMPT
jgi:nicotinate phosphoribosyltransferase